MKRKIILLLGVFSVLAISFSSCKKDETPVPTITFTQAEGTADNKGEYLLTGNILSEVQLEKVILTKEGTVSPNLTIAGALGTYNDNSTAKNKTDYDFAYQIAGISANTYIIIEIYDQDGFKNTVKFLIKI